MKYKLRDTENRGLAMLEFTLIMPLILFMMFTIIELGTAVNQYLILSRIAYETARFAATQPNLKADQPYVSAYDPFATIASQVYKCIDTLIDEIGVMKCPDPNILDENETANLHRLSNQLFRYHRGNNYGSYDPFSRATYFKVRTHLYHLADSGSTNQCPSIDGNCNTVSVTVGVPYSPFLFGQFCFPGIGCINITDWVLSVTADSPYLQRNKDGL